jgi:O-antigen/teichoic acid export membrane protein
VSREKRAQLDSGKPKRGVFPSRCTTLILLASLTLLFALGLVVAVLFASVAPLVFDKPGSGDDPRAWVTFVSLCISPIPFLVGILGAWLSFARKRYRPALMWMGLPLVGVCVILLCVRYGEGF